MTTASVPATTTNALLPLERPGESYEARLVRLSELSVRKCYDPYLDIAWDAPESAIDPSDPRVCLDPSHPLAQGAWYAGLDEPTRARFGLEWGMQVLKYGVGFEAVLNRGLLEFCQGVPNRSPEFRYAMHEVVEEGRHSLMFQELINRSGCDPTPIRYFDARIDDQVTHWGRTFPTLFFFAVLAGELFIDDQNRSVLRRPPASVHPLLRRVMQIHVTEEARHVCFAQSYLREHLPQASAWQRVRLSWAVPLIFADTARMMLIPDRRLRQKFAIPNAALRQAFGPKSEHRVHLAQVTEPVRTLCQEHGLWRAPQAALWRACGLA